MIYTRLADTGHQLFAQAWELYKKSFPPEERRQLRTQKKIMNHRQYRFNIITAGDMFAGFILWWEFDNIRYIEHLATLPHLRGKGYGRRILERFVSESDKPVLLEVEHPADDISKRRIGFYRRSGFVLNQHEYSHPPYKKGGNYVSLALMTYPHAISNDDANRFCRECHPVIHEFVMNRS
ncbi:MAG: GNAT family N-acetyltransferase [Bacteroidales bacterium]|jgi:ribosomal protein S18 acetylase RimI-like enzyme|nr:GNAT family N-acetyltransferase [Bacteroidales bacterium]